MPPRADAAQATPDAIASSSAFGCPSVSDGSTNTPAARTRSGSIAFGMTPVNSARTPSARARASSVPRSGPSPTTTSRAAGVSMASAPRSRSRFFSTDRRPT